MFRILPFILFLIAGCAPYTDAQLALITRGGLG